MSAVEMKTHGMPSLLLNAGVSFLMPPGTPHNALDLGWKLRAGG